VVSWSQLLHDLSLLTVLIRKVLKTYICDTYNSVQFGASAVLKHECYSKEEGCIQDETGKLWIQLALKNESKWKREAMLIPVEVFLNVYIFKIYGKTERNQNL